MGLTTEEKIRYSRHLNLPDFGLETQEKLKNTKVLVVGTGGLGAPLLQYLTAAGIGTIGVVDFDTVDASNLQRQVLFTSSDIGKPKTTTAIARLSDQNPYIRFVEHNVILDASNAMEIIEMYDIIADGTDNFPTRYLVNDACVLLGKVNVYASVFQFEGQISVFNYRYNDGSRGPNYRDLFPVPPPPGMVPSCAEGGVLGVLPGIVGALQGSEVLKIAGGFGQPLSGKLAVFDALDFTLRTLNVRKDPENPISGDNPTITKLINYDAFCGITAGSSGLTSISVDELKQWDNAEKAYVLIDVREPYEYEAGNLGGRLIPLSEIEKHVDHIPRSGDVVLHCKVGGRSAQAIQLLKTKHGFNNLINLEGGISAWKQAFDKDLIVL